MSDRKAPPGCYWRNGILWACLEIRGRRLRWSLQTSDGRLAAQRREARRKLEIAAGQGEARMSYRQAFIAWAAWLPGQVGERTVTRYGVSLKQLEPELLPVNVDEVTTKTIAAIVERRRKVAGVATVRRDLSALSNFLGFAEAMEWREGNPALTWLRRLRERRDPIVRPQSSDIEAVIARCPGMLGELVKIALATGCRLDELVGAKRAQLDRARRQLTVYGKGSKVRVIDLEPFGGFALLEALPAFLGSSWLFWHGQGRPYRNASSRIAALVEREAQAAKKRLAAGERVTFRKFRFHDLRHEHAIAWLKSGRNIYDLQGRLGHSSIKTTEIYLAYLTPDEARAAKFGTGA